MFNISLHIFTSIRSKNPTDHLRILTDTFPLAVEVDKIVAAAKKAKRALTTEEEKLVKSVEIAVDKLIQVNTFEKLGIEKIASADYVRPALRGTKFVDGSKPSVVTAVKPTVANSVSAKA